MKAGRVEIERALAAPPPDCRLFLLHGPDEAGSRALADRLTSALGPDAERIDLDGATLRGDPARLADEAAAISLFGGPRFIRIDPAGEEILAAVEALIAAPAAGNPVIAIAGALRRESRLLKLALAEPAILACASYPPEGQDADRMVIAMARDLGLRTRPDIARRLLAASGGDRAVIARELEKLAIYLDAAPDRPVELDHAALDSLGAAIDEGDLGGVVVALFAGRPADVDAALGALSAEGVDGVPVVRALLRRLLLLAPLAGEVAAGSSPAGVMASSGKSLFWKEKDEIGREIARWTPAALAALAERLGGAERALKASGAVGPILLDQALLEIARRAARLR